ncbi:DUF4389 domain-containing protein [Conexibacter sp. JD483]|uniref:DUF4389 domain-containing protein n=1 Tax=unclassified Conexibacter TaxID=2627773 RepID=UPI002722FABC|nr:MULTISPECIES: DUF4389 domain-containing protein [unclassified Conexibacter]MDO8189298.1 DUF4389 domain-containing protein [Conexibacter sp. CPCC 205706]MDO8201754.1 DUF4389 domain-containing protein [Conexibacter sp. CPCC 205762]MDR9372356.1 DUF4389 domain-containing protein [Conexibacter sp. JD483]
MYPVAYEADYVERQSRLITFFRGLLVIPWLLVGIFWGLAAYVCTFIAWFAIVFTGRYPDGLYQLNAKAHRFAARVNGFYNLLTDEWPAFDGDEHPEYPVRLVIPAPLPEYNRVKTLFRIFLMIPVMIMAYIFSLLVSIIVILSWIVILFTGKQPRGLFDLIKMGLTYIARAGVYYGLLTEAFPPISGEDQGDPLPSSPPPGGIAPTA